jgi:cyclophilin family peptidyl-prolyl cis-trans isomerase
MNTASSSTRASSRSGLKASISRRISLRLIGLLLFFAYAGTACATGTGVVLHTNLGQISVELYDKESPVTVQNFLRLVDDEVYENVLFHRVIMGFMAQTGGYRPNLEPLRERDAIVNEASNGLKNLRGTLAMARHDTIDSASVAFFVNLADNEHLDHSEHSCTREDEQAQAKAEQRGLFKPVTCKTFGYAVFGKVTDGMDVLDQIELVDVDYGEEFEALPLEPVILIRIERKE